MRSFILAICLALFALLSSTTALPLANVARATQTNIAKRVDALPREFDLQHYLESRAEPAHKVRVASALAKRRYPLALLAQKLDESCKAGDRMSCDAQAHLGMDYHEMDGELVLRQ